MHISEGILNQEIILVSTAVATLVLGYCVKKLEIENSAKVASLSALFFIASFIHIPLGPISIHLILSGILGALLGFHAILAIFVALLFQGLFFGYGGMSTLGINTLIIALPALLGFVLFKSSIPFKYFFVGSIPILISTIMLSVILLFNGESFSNIAQLVFLANIPLVIIEGIIAMFALKFIDTVGI